MALDTYIRSATWKEYQLIFLQYIHEPVLCYREWQLLI